MPRKPLLLIALLLAVCLMFTACAKADPVSLLISPNGAVAAQTLQSAFEGLSVVSAQTDRAALEHVASGSSDFAMVSEKALRDAITGSGEYYGHGYDNLQRVDSVLLGAYCVLSTVGQPAQWNQSVKVAVVGERKSLAADYAAQIMRAFGLSGEVYLSESEAPDALKNGEIQVFIGLYAVDSGYFDVMAQNGAAIVEVPSSISVTFEDPSVVTGMLPLLYDGMPRVDAPCLYGALVAGKETGAALSARLLGVVTELQMHVAQPPMFDFGEETTTQPQTEETPTPTGDETTGG